MADDTVRVTQALAEVEYIPAFERRVTQALAEVEYTPIFERRVTQAIVCLEYGPPGVAPPPWPYAVDPGETPTESPDSDYSFTNPFVKSKLPSPGNITIRLGTQLTQGIETVPITKQAYLPNFSGVSDDDLYMIFEGESFIGRASNSSFYKGRYDAGGIPASTIFEDILGDIAFPTDGKWNYYPSDTCFPSDTLPLWTDATYEAFDIDPLLANIAIYVPMPVVSHREALTMLAAYTGAYLIHDSEGTLQIKSGLGTPADYHMNLNQVYDRPALVAGESISKIEGNLYQCHVGAAAETILQAQVAAEDLSVRRFIITHDACTAQTLTLTNAQLVSTPNYFVYCTEFEAIPTSSIFTVTITGKRLSMDEIRFSVDYPDADGEAKEFVCAIASDPARTRAMYNRYYTWATALRYEFKMRDDPAIEVGDRIYLDTKDDPAGIPVLVQEIKREFNGALDAEYIVIEDVERG